MLSVSVPVPVAGPATVEMAGALFTFATAFVVPMYTLMMIAPKWEWVSRRLTSPSSIGG